MKLIKPFISSINIKILITSAFILFKFLCYAQDLEPRRWTSLPTGIQVLGIGYANTSGEIFFDPVMQVEDASFNANTFILQYVRPFKFGNKLARVDIYLPYSIANWEGLLAGIPTTVNRSGFADPRLRLSINIIGPKALDPKELFKYMKDNPVNTTLGASIAVTLPLGQYYEDKLLNLGHNRFSFRPQIGLLHNWNKWSFELTSSVFIFTKNNSFYNGKKRKQNPLFALQTHVIKRFDSKIWTSLSVGYGTGGKSIINNVSNGDQRGNFLGSISLGFPVFKKQSLKFAFLQSTTLKDIGSDSSSFILGWSFPF